MTIAWIGCCSHFDFLFYFIYYQAVSHERTLVLSCSQIITVYVTALFMGVDNCAALGRLIGAQRLFIVVCLSR